MSYRYNTINDELIYGNPRCYKSDDYFNMEEFRQYIQRWNQHSIPNAVSCDNPTYESFDFGKVIQLIKTLISISCPLDHLRKIRDEALEAHINAVKIRDTLVQENIQQLEKVIDIVKEMNTNIDKLANELETNQDLLDNYTKFYDEAEELIKDSEKAKFYISREEKEEEEEEDESDSE